MILVDARIAGEYLPELLDVGRLTDADADAHLSGLLRRVEHVDEEAHLSLALGHWDRDAEKRVEGVGLLLAQRTGQTRAKLRLEDLVDEGVVAAHVVLPGLCCQHFRSFERVL